MNPRHHRCLERLLVASLLVLSVHPVSSQLYRFGKNKVQYDEFLWQRMETPHFDIYFYEEEAELASYGAQMAEEGYELVERHLAHTVRRRIPLIIYSSHVYFEQTNIIPGMLPEGVAGFTEFLKGRVALPLSGSYPEFERVLHHELVHVFMSDRIRRVLRDRGVTDLWMGPLWFSEGIAEYISGDWSSYGDMILRDAMFSGRLVPVSQMHRIYGSFQMYKEGESICHYLGRHYGKDIFARLLGNWWRGESFKEVFRVTTGDELAELNKQWLYGLRKRYLPDIQSADPPSQMARALTTSGYNLKPALFIPTEVRANTGNAKRLEVIFFRNDQGYTYIARQPLHGAAAPTVVVKGEKAPEFESLHPLETSLAVHPDGALLAFAAKRNGRDHLVLWDLQEGEEVRRLTFPELVAISSPTWSPDGRSLALAGARQGGSTDLFLLSLADDELRSLTDDLFHDRDPAWHPTGRKLVFSSDRTSDYGRRGHYNLSVLDVDGGGMTQLTNGEHEDTQPAWSPDGSWVAFASDRERMYDLYSVAVPADSSAAVATDYVHRLTRTLTGVFDPVWVPGDNSVLFTGFEAGRFHLYHMPVNVDSLRAAEASVRAEIAEVAASSADSSQLALMEGWSLTSFTGPGDITRRNYKREFSLDVAQSQISQDPIFGTSGGVQVGLSDVLGNQQYYFVLSHISGSNTGFFDGLNLAFGRVHLARQLNVGWGLFHLNDRFTSTFGRFVREKRTGGWAEFSYPFSRNDRLETRVTVRHADIDRQFEGRELRSWLLSNHIAYTHDNSLWIPTGPMEGTRYSLGAGQTVDFKSSRPFHMTFFGDYRHYFRISGRTSFAVRYMALHSRGDVPEFFSLGGSWTLRGYGWRSIWGRNLVLANHEYRYPLLDRIVVAFPFGNIDLSAFRGALFVDVGNAWNDSFGDWRGSCGTGFRLALGGVFVIRLDASRRTDFKSIANQTRWDFFFGWDY
ncbi:MAG: BamA/TamA family outer membrane protein [Candidatus Latescibacterota bacterium]|nr:BamA/TamA family outer membrane protein [Candidatus Latescibacterota bacterium]